MSARVTHIQQHNDLCKCCNRHTETSALLRTLPIKIRHGWKLVRRDEARREQHSAVRTNNHTNSPPDRAAMCIYKITGRNVHDGVHTTSGLFPRHGSLLWSTFHFLSLLHQGTQGTEPLHHAVHTKAAINAFSLTDLPSDLGSRPDADRPQDRQDPVLDAAFPHGLCILAGSEARQEVSDDTQPAVVEAAKQTVLPLSHAD